MGAYAPQKAKNGPTYKRMPGGHDPPTRIKPSGPVLSKTPSFAGVGAQLISKFRHGRHGWEKVE